MMALLISVGLSRN